VAVAMKGKQQQPAHSDAAKLVSEYAISEVIFSSVHRWMTVEEKRRHSVSRSMSCEGLQRRHFVYR
jgi:hypothetical protein